MILLLLKLSVISRLLPPDAICGSPHANLGEPRTREVGCVYLNIPIRVCRGELHSFQLRLYSKTLCLIEIAEIVEVIEVAELVEAVKVVKVAEVVKVI